MEFEDDQIIVLPDVRTAAVVWGEAAEPEIIVSGCSEFEAIGLFVKAIWSLLSLQDMEDGDEIDDD